MKLLYIGLILKYFQIGYKEYEPTLFYSVPEGKDENEECDKQLTKTDENIEALYEIVCTIIVSVCTEMRLRDLIKF